jgi:hypothetical protein
MKTRLTVFALFLSLSGFGQILNSSFENWVFRPDAGDIEQQWALADWQHLTPLGDSLLGLLGTYRDTIPRSGDYALGLSRWYNYTYDVAAFRNACPTKPGALSGYYRYDAGTLAVGKPDTAQVAVFLTRFNPASQTTDTIGAGILDLPNADSFMFFQCPVTYFQPGVFPDSIAIILRPTKFQSGVGGCDDYPWCSFLTVDEISLDFGTPVPEPPVAKPFSIFPNPATDNVVVSGPITGARVRILNAIGLVVFDEQAASDQLDVDISGFGHGVYFVAIGAKAEVLVIK